MALGWVRSYLRGEVAPASDALFGAESLSWKSAGQWWSMIGGQRALLLQVADPRVAAGVVEHSNWEANPFGRLFSTLRTMLVLSFGDERQAEAELAHFRSMHERVQGHTVGGEAYSGQDADTGAWVFATLIDSLIEVERRFVGAWGDAERQRLWTESKQLAEVLHVASKLPDTLDEFVEWMELRIVLLKPDEHSRAVARSVLWPTVWKIPPKWWWPASSLAIDLLPPDVREALELPALMPASVAWSLRTQERTKKLLHVVPGRFRVSPVSAWAIADR